MRHIARLAALLAAVLGFDVPATAAAPVATGRFVDLPKVASSNIAPAHVTIWLPPGYDRGHKRYGVVYVQDGQDILSNRQTATRQQWNADSVMARVAADAKLPPRIIVAIWSAGPERGRTYMPQRLYDMLPAATQAQVRQITGGQPIQSDAYLRFLVTELKPMIDRRYRTLKDRDHTTIAGSSFGALVTLYAMAEYPKVFGSAACLSTHWPLAIPMRVGEVDAVVADAWARYLAERLGPPAGRHIWFDHGDKSLDAFYGPYQIAIDRELTELGWRTGQDVETRSYPGAGHDIASWSARLDDVFGWLFGAHEE